MLFIVPYMLGMVILGVFFVIIIFVTIIGLCKLVSGSLGSTRPQRRSRPSSERPLSPFSKRHQTESPVSDEASSPVGGFCVHCGAIIEEETEPTCPSCGAPRQRCPLCQRFIAGGQDLLACPHCELVGHANEMRQWVEKKRKCPHCGQELSPFSLTLPRFD